MIIRLLFAHISMMIANTLSLDVAVLYEETFPAVASFVAKMGGSPDDAKDIFHDAMVVFFEKETDVENPCAYIVGIAKHLWVRKFKHDRNSVDLDENIQIIEEEPSPIVTPAAETRGGCRSFMPRITPGFLLRKTFGRKYRR